MTALLNEIVGEARHLLQQDLVILQTSDNGSSACGSQVHRKEILVSVHLFCLLCSLNAAKLGKKRKSHHNNLIFELQFLKLESFAYK